MRFTFVVGLVLISATLMGAQRKQQLGYSRHANVAQKGDGGRSVALTPNTKANADNLARIEQHHVQSSPAAEHHSAVAPKAVSATPGRNKPIKSSYRPPSTNKKSPH